MKKLWSLSLLLSGLAAYTIMLAGCVRQPDEVPFTNDDGQNGTGFDYATTTDVRLDIDYSLKGVKALFEVHAANPVTEVDGRPVKKDEARALLRAYTDNNAAYKGVVNLPAGCKKVYLYSQTYGLPVCVEAEVEGGGVSFDLAEYLSALRKEKAGRDVTSYAPKAFSPTNPYNIQSLGYWNKDGLPYYAVGVTTQYYPFILVCTDLPDGLMNRIENVLLPGTDNSAYAKPSDQVNLHITSDARLTLTFVAELAAWRNAIGYYYYDSKNPPRTESEFDMVRKYIAFPNCSMWSNDSGLIGNYMPPLFPGAQLEMTYYDKQGNASKVFPKGTTVGWFILPDGFEVDNSGNGTLNVSGSKHAIRYSDCEFNPGNARYMVNVYDKPSGKNVLGFEDSGDGDYKDVLFYVESDPQDAIYNPDQPTIDPDDEKYPDVVNDPIEGTLAFEDLWPNQGDYDLNDVVVQYSTVFTTDKDNRIVAIRDTFTPVYAGGKYKSAFGYQLDIPIASVKNIRIDNGSSSAKVSGSLETGQDKAVIMLFDDIEEAIEKGPITITIELDGSVSAKNTSRKSLYNPFVCVSSEGFVPGEKRKEVHLTDYAPTSLADTYFFGRNDDKSTLDKQGNPIGPHYYVTSDLHPFAIDLPILGYRIPDERIKIDDFYPDFAGWATSKGEKNQDWYKKPIR